jgi:hypothetical protein
MAIRQPKKLLEFKKMTHAAHVAHSMANHAMDNLRQEILNTPGVSLDGKFQVGTGKASADSKVISELTTKQALEGMQMQGPFSQLIAHGLLVWIYTLWDSRYRSEIAAEVGVETNNLCCDVMGDLRYLRHWIAHTNCTADKDYKKLKVLKWPDKAGPFVVTGLEMERIQLTINTMTVYVCPNKQ